MIKLYRLPYLLIMVRFLLGPILFYDASDGVTGTWFLMGVALGFLSDVFDGVIARRMNTVTAHLREMDGRTDVWFFAWIAASAWRIHPNLVTAYRAPLLLVLATQVLSWMIDMVKFRRFSNYHAYTAKVWGLTIFATTVAWFGSRKVGILLWCAVFCGMVCTLEEIAITLILPRWTYDVPSVFQAVQIRKRLLTFSDHSIINSGNH